VHGRRDLPWQGTRDPYRVWLSEIMLQQTQVATVVPYYLRFIERFPDVTRLAAEPLEAVMQCWAGLGYYSRARNLHACARVVVAEHGAQFPRTAVALESLPGIGRSTAAAIAAFCFAERAPMLDGNVRRVLARHAGIDGDPARADVAQRLWARAATLLPPARQMPAYTQALMDLGATLCTRAAPRCAECPVASDCTALRTGRVDELPTPRPRKQVPARNAHLLLALHESQVLLLARPPHGVWGGLLAPPQFDDVAALRRYLRGLAPAGRAAAWPVRRHVFTHFTLEYTPHVARLGQVAPRAAEPVERWLPLEQIEQAALPAPVRSLLLDVRQAAARPQARLAGSRLARLCKDAKAAADNTETSDQT
jgi:A/G-specific adenine glycosylase